MTINAARLQERVTAEIAAISDARIVAHLLPMRVEPRRIDGLWDYGPENTYPCWVVLEHPRRNAAIAYCEHGFGPTSPWGLLGKGDDPDSRRMGPDSGWFLTLPDAAMESWLVSDLAIWRVCRRDEDGRYRPVTGEMTHDDASAHADALNKNDPAACSYTPLNDRSIAYFNRSPDRLTSPPPQAP